MADGAAEGRADRAWPLGPVRWLLIATAALSAVFLLVPSIDLWFSGLFYVEGAGFPASREAALIWFRGLSDALVWAIGLAAILSVLGRIALLDWRHLIPVQTAAFLGATLLLGPLLLVNGVLKSTWGRPRPVHVVDFGGDLPFVPVWHITDYCDRNCSFTSGEASTAIWLVALVLVVPPAWRRGTAVVTLSLAAAFSLNRIAFGGHFLSDVLLSWTLTLLVIAVAHRVIYVHSPAFLGEAALATGLSRAGRRLRGIGSRPPPPPRPDGAPGGDAPPS